MSVANDLGQDFLDAVEDEVGDAIDLVDWCYEHDGYTLAGLCPCEDGYTLEAVLKAAKEEATR